MLLRTDPEALVLLSPKFSSHELEIISPAKIKEQALTTKGAAKDLDHSTAMLATMPARMATSPFKKMAVLNVAPINAGANPIRFVAQREKKEIKNLH